MTAQTNDSAAGGLGIGVVQPQSGLDYPFVAPGIGTQTSTIADVENLFADFYLSYDDDGYYSATPKVKNPLRIYWLYGFGDDPDWTAGVTPTIPTPTPTHSADLIVVDADNNVVFDTTEADYFSERVWGTYYTLYEWQKTTKPGEKICRAIKYNSAHTNIVLPPRPTQYCPSNAVLDERTIEKIPKRVKAMRVQLGDCVTPWFKNKISFVNGHNTEIEIGTEETLNFRRTTEIQFSADAGSGKGVYGLCEISGTCSDDNPTNVCPPGTDPVVNICNPGDGEEIKSINGAAPDINGNLFLNANDCLWARKPAAYTGSTPHDYAIVGGVQKRAVMALGADCAPCCACEDYLEAAKYMTRLGQYYQMIGGRVNEIRTIHDENIARWEQQRDCRNRKPFELLLVPQPCPCMDVVLFYCNHCTTCAENAELTVEFSASPSNLNVAIDEKYTSIVYGGRSGSGVINGGWPVFSVNFPTVEPGASVYAKFRLCFCPKYPYAIKGVLTGSKSDGMILAGCEQNAPHAKIEASQILDCTPGF